MIKRVYKMIYNIPIFLRLSIVIFIVFLAMSILSFVNFLSFTNEKKTSTYKIVNQTNHQAISKIDDYMKDVDNITKIPLTFKQNDVTYIRELLKFNTSNSASFEFQSMNEQMFEEILTYKKNIDSCFVFNRAGSGDYKVRTPIFRVFDPADYSWFQESIDAFGKPIIIDTYELPFLANSKEPVYVFGTARGIVRIESSSVIGILLVNTKIDYLKQICDNMKITEGHRIIIAHGDKTIYDTEEKNITASLDPNLSDIEWSSLNNLSSVDLDGEKLLVSSTYSDYSDWRLISLIPSHELYYDLEKMQKSNIFFSVFFIVLSILLLFFISSQIAYPLKKLAALMKLAEEGDFDVKINIDQKDEVGILASSFNSMTGKINNLIQEVYLEQIKQSETELQMLQSQINPHFLYNTLESISMMATINDDDTTSEMAQNLGSILRYGISQYHTTVSVGEEVSQLEKYIALQAIRFHSIYEIRIDIDPLLYPIPIIKLILQPIVENAIYHGMKDIRSGGLINVTAYKTDRNTLVFEVTDNGNGMNQEQVVNLNGYINDENNLFKSIGLRNVNKRIKIKYGDKYGVYVKSIPDVGTTVYIEIACDITS